MLSGGERNRLLLARLFARPANVLVLDEPTNDLDIDSLELLEATLQDYAGTLLLVSHDRAFLDNVVTQTLAPEGDGRVARIRRRLQRLAAQRPAVQRAVAVARRRRRRARSAARRASAQPSSRSRSSASSTRCPRSSRRSSSEQHALGERMARPTTTRKAPTRFAPDRARAAEIEAQLAEKLERWVDARSSA